MDAIAWQLAILQLPWRRRPTCSYLPAPHPHQPYHANQTSNRKTTTPETRKQGGKERSSHTTEITLDHYWHWVRHNRSLTVVRTPAGSVRSKPSNAHSRVAGASASRIPLQTPSPPPNGLLAFGQEHPLEEPIWQNNSLQAGCLRGVTKSQLTAEGSTTRSPAARAPFAENSGYCRLNLMCNNCRLSKRVDTSRMRCGQEGTKGHGDQCHLG